MPTFTGPNNVFFTKSLFLEMSYTDRSDVVYTLKDYDHDGYPSLYRLYLQEMDPTEHKFANKHLGGWRHWQMLSEISWMKPYVKRWRQELELKIRAQAFRTVLDIANDDKHRSSYEASKFLLTGGWKPAEAGKGKGAGRPSKEAIREEAERLFQENQEVFEDLKRIQN